MNTNEKIGLSLSFWVLFLAGCAITQGTKEVTTKKGSYTYSVFKGNGKA